MSELRKVIARAILPHAFAQDAYWPHRQHLRAKALDYADAVLAALEAWEPSEAAEDAADEVFHRVFQERVAANKKYRPDANPYAFASASFSVPIFRAMIAAAREEK